MNLSENKTIEFRKGNWYILIKETYYMYEAYLQNADMGVIDLMYGLNKKDIDFWDFTSLIEEDLEEYIKYYKENYNID